MRKREVVWTVVFMLCFVLIAVPAQAEQTITAAKASAAPTIDGSGDDAAWKAATAYTIHDERMDVDITLKAAYRGDMVFFLVQYPDATEDRLHKPWIWDKKMEAYQIGPQREDTFIFKWNMEDKEVDLSNFSDNDYTADLWYWKANRTDLAGYSDDKSQVFASKPGKKAGEITSKSGQKRYLMRLGDKGKSAQKKVMLTEYKGDTQDQFESRQPEGSRADVRAKGVWKNGTWTIEYARKLDTGNDDDVPFDPGSGKKYLFGVSIKSLYGEPFDDTKANFYGQGRISEPLYLSFQ